MRELFLLGSPFGLIHGTESNSSDDFLWHVELDFDLNYQEYVNFYTRLCLSFKNKRIEEMIPICMGLPVFSFQNALTCIVSSNGLDSLLLTEARKEHFGKGQPGLTGAGGSECL